MRRMFGEGLDCRMGSMVYWKIRLPAVCPLNEIKIFEVNVLKFFRPYVLYEVFICGKKMEQF